MMKFGTDNYLSNKEYDKLKRDDLLQCHYIKWMTVDESMRWLAVLLPWNDCVDMTGCIKRAKERMPDVQAISTINQDGIDTFYYLSPGFDEFPAEWRAVNGGPKPPMFQEAPYASENDG